MGGGASVEEEEYPEETEESPEMLLQERKERFLEGFDKDSGELVIALRHESGLAPEDDVLNSPDSWNLCLTSQPIFGKPFEVQYDSNTSKIAHSLDVMENLMVYHLLFALQKQILLLYQVCI